MPQMYKAGGITKFFRSVEEGLKAGFMRSYNDVVKAQRAKLGVERAPVPASDAPPAPPPPLENAQPDAPPPPPPAAKQPLADMSLDEVKEHAVRFGLDTSVHHMTLRKQVEECLNAEVGAD